MPQPTSKQQLSSQVAAPQGNDVSSSLHSSPSGSIHLASVQGQNKDNPPGATTRARFTRPGQISGSAPTTAARNGDVKGVVQGPDPRLMPTGCIYVRFSTAFQHSKADQVRACKERAEREGIHVPDDLIFVDEAKTGRGFKRAAMKAMLDAVKSGRIQVVIFFTTSRLGRSFPRTIQFIEEELVERNVRVIVVTKNIDTAEPDRWRHILYLSALVDDLGIRDTGAYVRAAQEGLFVQGFVCGSIPHGYVAKEADGPRTKRGRPRCVIAIDPETAPWVRQIHEWFVVHELSIRQIVRRLNAAGAPPPSRVKRGWTRVAVRSILGAACYTGRWSYGVHESKWVSKGDYIKKVKRPEPLQSKYFEDRRIISDLLWRRAVERLSAWHVRAGRKPKDGDHSTRPRVLNGFFICKEHGHPLRVCGSRGRYMECKPCTEAAEPALLTLLPRKRALEMVCGALADAMGNHTGLVERVIKESRRAVEDGQRPDTARLASLTRQEEKLTRQIEFIYDTAGASGDDEAERVARLRKAQAERATVRRQIAELQAAASQEVRPPSPEEIVRQIEDLHRTLLKAAENGTPEDAAALRQIVKALTNGQILVTQRGQPRPKGGWLRLTLQSKVLTYLLGDYGVHGVDDGGIEITIDVRRQPKHELISDAGKDRADEGVPVGAMVKEFQAGPTTITKALRHWYTSRGLEAPDYRSMRGRLKQQSLPKYQAIAPKASRLYDQDVPIQDIADRLGVNRDTARKAINWQRERDGRPIVDGRHRRKEVRLRRERRGEHDGGDHDDGNRDAADGDRPVAGT